MRRNRLLASAVSTLLLAPAAAFAQVDTSEWKCEYCPFEDGYRVAVIIDAMRRSSDSGQRVDLVY